MKRLQLLTLLSCVPVAACSSSIAAPLPPTPQARITQLSAAFVSAWNAHDAQTFAALFTPDADFTNVYGVHVHGRAAIAAFHANVFATVFRASNQQTQALDIQTIAGTAASVKAHWSMTGATVPGWPAVQHGIISWTLAVQPDGSWLIAVMTNALTPAPA